MPVPYQIITQLAPPGSGKEGSQISYARSFTHKKISTAELAQMAAERSTFSIPDIMGAIYMISEVLRDELAAGNAVEVEDIGTFSISASSGALEDPDRVHPDDFKTRRINFYPHQSFREKLRTLSFKHQNKPSKNA